MRSKFNQFKRREYLILGTILFIALLIRIWGINWGLPGLFHSDERWFVSNSFCILTLNLKGISYIHGSFLPSVLAILYGVYYIILRMLGIVNTPIDFLEHYLTDPSPVYLIGRLLFVFLGVGLVGMTYIIGKRLYSKEVGLVSAFFTAFTFLLVQQSKCMKGDTGAALFILISFYYAICLMESPRIRYYILCGVMLGLAIGAKYYSFIFMLVPLFLHFVSLKNRTTKFHWRLVFLIISVILAFLVVTPGALLYYEKFLHQITVRSFRAWIPSGGIPVSLFYIKEYLKGGMGLPFEVVSFVGCFYCLLCLSARQYWKHRLFRREEIGMLIFIFSFLLLLNFLTNFDRFAVPLIPFFAIISSKFLYDLSSCLKYRGAILWMLSCLIILPSGISSIKYNYLITRPDSRNIAKLWIEEHILANSKIVNEGGSGPERTSVLSAPIYPNKETLLKDIGSAEKAGLKGTYPKTLLKINRSATYDLKSVVALNWIHINGFPEISLSTVNPYIQQNYEWLITSSWVRSEEEGEFPNKFINSLQKYYELVKEFIPRPEFKWDYYGYRTDYKALRKVNIFDKKVIGGPTISIYRRCEKE